MTESYNRPPMTFTPSYEEDATGQQVFNGNGTLSTNGRAGIYETPYEEDQLTGDRHYLIEEQVFQQDEDYQETDSYEELLVEAMPYLPDALAWAGQVLSPEQIQDFNARMDSGDPEDYMEYLENIYEMYLEAEGVEEDDSDAYEPDEEDEADEPSQEEINEALSELADTPAMGQAYAMPFLEQAVQYQSSHPCLSEICALTAEFHNGNIDYGDAIDQLTSKYSLSELKKYYNYLNN